MALPDAKRRVILPTALNLLGKHYMLTGVVNFLVDAPQRYRIFRKRGNSWVASASEAGSTRMLPAGAEEGPHLVMFVAHVKLG